MSHTILLFGITKDIIGGSVHETGNAFTTVGELRRHLYNIYPQLEKLNSLMIAVNNNYANDDDRLQSSDEIALIPPVSGG
ncbi:MoaD/ThiS family protein [Danxiaibacter flavus]|uniref:Molybdopterin synthase sulfur carrier subunit n=1 Tax=Danxiaibacter flavus TaxID=3049108 RepID=A0ABV3ZIL2_9BACT|nr:MoaD/ThiS family protein [Chitinophagaceae bacterium DXS]